MSDDKQIVVGGFLTPDDVGFFVFDVTEGDGELLQRWEFTFDAIGSCRALKYKNKNRDYVVEEVVDGVRLGVVFEP